VVERDGDLLGDGVNIGRAWRASPKSRICVSRAVHEQVATNFGAVRRYRRPGSERHSDPVHAFMVAIGARTDLCDPQVRKPAAKSNRLAGLDVAAG